MDDFIFMELLARFAADDKRPAELRASAALTACLILVENSDYYRQAVGEFDKKVEGESLLAKKCAELSNERRWLANQCVRGMSSFTCPMPRDYFCEHRNVQNCESGSPVMCGSCWVKAAGEHSDE